MWAIVAPTLLLVLAVWVGTATFVGARRYTFKPYYLTVVACSIVVVASVGSILTFEHMYMDRLYERVLWTGIFLFMATMLFFRNEELRRGIDNRKVLMFKHALTPSTRDRDSARKRYS